MAAAFGKHSGAKKTLIVHHDPFHDDTVLDDASEELTAICLTASFAFEGEEIEL